MSGDSCKVIFGRARIYNIHNTAVCTRSGVNLAAGVIGRKTGFPLLIDSVVDKTSCTPTSHSCRRNNTILVGVAEAERVVHVVAVLRYIHVGVLGETCAEEISYIVIDLRSCPAIETCCNKFRVEILTLVNSVCLSVGVVDITTINGIIGKILDFGTPTQ